MEYYNAEDKKPRRGATLALLLYVLVVALLLYKVHFSFDAKTSADEGILVEFGVDDMGDGEQELAISDNASSTPTPPVNQSQKQENLTDERSEQEIEQAEVKEPPKEQESESVNQSEVRDTVKPKPQINQNALFPGRKENSTSSSSGKKPNTQGNAGAEDGGNEGSPTNSKSGNNGTVQPNIGNRKSRGALPLPRKVANSNTNTVYVTVEVIVDEKGNVTSAKRSVKGTTTNDPDLIKAAVEAASNAKFIEGNVAIGTIKYTFNVK